MITSKLTFSILCVSILLVTGFARQQPPALPDGPEANIPDEEKKVPPGHYCKRPDVEIRPTETRAHHCECTYSCTIHADGSVTDNESSTCLTWCHKNGRHCTCHPEGEPGVVCTEEPKLAPGDIAAWKGMDGHIVRIEP